MQLRKFLADFCKLHYTSYHIYNSAGDQLLEATALRLHVRNSARKCQAFTSTEVLNYACLEELLELVPDTNSANIGNICSGQNGVKLWTNGVFMKALRPL